MTQPPRLAEALLESLGAPAHVREPVLGDLAEEHAWLADAVGEDAARRWYWREAVRTMPHLVRAALSGASAADVRRRIGITLSVFTYMIVAELFASVLLDPAVNFLFPRGTTITLVIPVALLTSGGYVAAWLDDRAPMASALCAAVPWASLIFGYRTVHDVSAGVMTIWPSALGAMALAAIAAGGMLQLRARSRSNRIAR